MNQHWLARTNSTISDNLERWPAPILRDHGRKPLELIVDV